MGFWYPQRSEEGAGTPKTGVKDVLGATMWVLEPEPRSSTRATGALNTEATLHPPPPTVVLVTNVL